MVKVDVRNHCVLHQIRESARLGVTRCTHVRCVRQAARNPTFCYIFAASLQHTCNISSNVDVVAQLPLILAIFQKQISMACSRVLNYLLPLPRSRVSAQSPYKKEAFAMTEALLCDLLRDNWFQDADHLALRSVNQNVGDWVHHILCQGGFRLSWRLGQACLAIRCQAMQCDCLAIRCQAIRGAMAADGWCELNQRY